MDKWRSEKMLYRNRKGKKEKEKKNQDELFTSSHEPYKPQSSVHLNYSISTKGNFRILVLYKPQKRCHSSGPSALLQIPVQKYKTMANSNLKNFTEKSAKGLPLVVFVLRKKFSVAERIEIWAKGVETW